jgi:hypothetical protein
VELLWQFFKLKGGFNGKLSFANVHKVAITTISVIKNIGNMCIDVEVYLAMHFFQKEYIWLHKTANKRLVNNDA